MNKNISKSNFFIKKEIFKIKKIILIFTIIFSVIALIHSLNNAIIYSNDFQRSGSLSLLLGYEPYAEFLNGNINKIFIKTQAPNYFQTLYFLFIPFAILPESSANLAWGICNIAMLLSSTYLLTRIFEIKSLSKISLLLFILLGGFPARTAIGQGQLSIFIMHFFLLGIYIKECSTKPKSIIVSCLCFGLAYLKYSFAPAFVAMSFAYFGLKNFLITLLPSLLGIIIMVLTFKTSTSLLGPLKVSSLTMDSSYGIGDLLSILKLLNIKNYQYIDLISSVACISLSLIFIWICKDFALKRLLAITSLISIMFVNHLGYDYALYLVLLAFAFSKDSKKLEKFFILTVWIIIGYGYWIIHNVLNYSIPQLFEISFIFLLNLLLFLIILINGKNQMNKSSNFNI